MFQLTKMQIYRQKISCVLVYGGINFSWLLKGNHQPSSVTTQVFAAKGLIEVGKTPPYLAHRHHFEIFLKSDLVDPETPQLWLIDKLMRQIEICLRRTSGVSEIQIQSVINNIVVEDIVRVHWRNTWI